MKFEEWLRLYEMINSSDRESYFIAAEIITGFMEFYQIYLTPDCLLPESETVYEPRIILAKIAYVEKFPDCSYFCSSACLNRLFVYYKGSFVGRFWK